LCGVIIIEKREIKKADISRIIFLISEKDNEPGC
jgi:hypothetical protein